MPTCAFVTVDVFTDTRFGGNPLAVFPDAWGLSDAQMQALAAEFNLSETTFVLPPADPANTARVRIFTPQVELPFAGHPNVGTGWVLAQGGGDTLRFEEGAGLVTVDVSRDAAGAVSACTIAAPLPLTLGAGVDPALVAGCIGIAPDEVLGALHHPVVASVGAPFVIAEVTPAALSRAEPDLARFREAAARTGMERVSIYMHADGSDGRRRARLFAPLMGVLEDPATGSAAAPLAALLLQLSGAGEGAWDIVQGVEMGRPSLLHTHARRAADGIRAWVGGACVKVLEGTAYL